MQSLPCQRSRRIVEGPAVAVICGMLALAAQAGAAPLTCADMQARLEAQLKAKGTAHPPLLIVPKGLVGNLHVLGSCENGTQRIGYRPGGAEPGQTKNPADPPPPKPATRP